MVGMTFIHMENWDLDIAFVISNYSSQKLEKLDGVGLF